jgi:hypothetical protein
MEIEGIQPLLPRFGFNIDFLTQFIVLPEVLAAD